MNKLLIEQVVGSHSYGIDEYARQLDLHINKSLKYTGCIKKYNQPLRDAAITLFHFSNASRSILLPLARRGKGRNLVIIHDVLPRTPLIRSINNPFMRLIKKRAQSIIVHSNSACRLLLHNYPFLASREIRVIPHGTFVHEITPSEKQELRRQYRFPLDENILFMLGGITRGRRQLKFLRAYEKALLPGMRLLVAGKCSDPAAYQLMNTNRSISYHGAVPNRVVWDFYKLCDAVVVFREDSVGESSSSIAYGMGYGKPLLVSAVGAFPEIVGDGGITFHNDEASIVKMLTKFGMDEIDLSSLGKKAKSKSKTFHWEEFLKKITSPETL
ncbi:MAG: glycosyltransferase family 4 protein [bacterium]|nr:glycosyltransferase family 4 protein [bacterium]